MLSASMGLSLLLHEDGLGSSIHWQVIVQFVGLLIDVLGDDFTAFEHLNASVFLALGRLKGARHCLKAHPLGFQVLKCIVSSLALLVESGIQLLGLLCGPRLR